MTSHSDVLFRKTQDSVVTPVTSKTSPVILISLLHIHLTGDFMIQPNVYTTAERHLLLCIYIIYNYINYILYIYSICFYILILSLHSLFSKIPHYGSTAHEWQRRSKAMSPSRGKSATYASAPKVMTLTCCVTVCGDTAPICWIMPKSSPYQHCVAMERGDWGGLEKHRFWLTAVTHEPEEWRWWGCPPPPLQWLWNLGLAEGNHGPQLETNFKCFRL